MKAPLNWLRDFVEIDLTPSELAKKLVNAGFEVEEILNQHDSIRNVKAGKIFKIEKHPDADKLRVCQVDVGGKTVQIVTNAANVFEGAVVPVALDGSLLPSGKEILAGELRGVRSEGMFTGGDDLQATEADFKGAEGDGVLILPDNILPGTDIAECLGLDDIILDISVTANRPDCNSIIGIAREIAAVTGKTVKMPVFSYSSETEKENPIKVTVKNPELCPRYIAQSVKNITVAPSPDFIRKRLKAVGIRPINNIVDITNYVLIEVGQPMHAFDRSYIENDEIIVRTAANGEGIVTLDGKKNTLNETMLVIADSNKPMAVAGVMGGENSGITEATSEIVFESAKFARDSVRRTSKALNLRSDSSARFEKGIDFMSQELGLNRALQLVFDLNCGEIYGKPCDAAVPYAKKRTISYPGSSLKKILGVRVKNDKAIEILASLGIPTYIDGKSFVSDIPEWRDDLENANDIAEEVIRVYGYDKVKSTLLANASPTMGGVSKSFAVDSTVRKALASVGGHETVTYSFLSPKAFDLIKLPADSALRAAVPIKNPLGEDVSLMRTTLLPGMLNVIKTNISKANKAGRFFEIAKCYTPKELPLKDLPAEEQYLIIAAYGEDEDFFTMKGMVEYAAKCLGLSFEYQAAVYPFLHDGRGADIMLGKQLVGTIGEIHPDVQEAIDSDFRIYVAGLKLESLYTAALPLEKFSPIPKFPTVSRDLAVVVKDSVTAGEMLAAIKKASKALENAEVFDVYKGTGIKDGFKSIAFSLSFINFERTFTDDEIAAEMSVVLKTLERKFNAKLR